MWNFENEDFLYEGPAYRHMLVVNSASDMLRFYQLNLEHAGSEANCELRGAHKVHIYSFKSEGCPAASISASPTRAWSCGLVRIRAKSGCTATAATRSQ